MKKLCLNLFLSVAVASAVGVATGACGGQDASPTITFVPDGGAPPRSVVPERPQIVSRIAPPVPPPAVVTVSGDPVEPPRPTTPDEVLVRARELLAAGDVAGARALAQEGVKLEPGRSLAWNTLGRVELADGELAQAESAFLRAVEVNEENLFGWNNLGLVRMRQGRWADAIEPLERATESDDATSYMWNNLGCAYEGAGRMVDAQAAYARAGELGSVLAMASLERVKKLGDLTAHVTEEDEAVEEEVEPAEEPSIE